MRFIIIFFIAVVLIVTETQGQDKTTIQYEPGFSFTQRFRGNWSFNGSATFRFTFDQPLPEQQERGTEFNFNETLLFATYQFWNNIKLSGGYGFRIPSFREDVFSEHRIMQQLGFIIYAPTGKRIANRIRLEQRILENEYTNRWRYRAGFDSPLNGEQLDPGEMYIIFSNELLWSFNSVGNDLENRLYAGVGWYFNTKYKLETGLQYRAGNLTSNLSNTIWITTTFYLNRSQSLIEAE